MDIVQIDWAEADRMLDGAHYLGAAGYQPSHCLTTPARDALALYGPPVASHFKTVLAEPLELTRLWRSEGYAGEPITDSSGKVWPGRQLSQFVVASLKWLKREAPEADCVFSYADPGARNSVTGRRHSGGIYTASNFTFLGEARSTNHWVTQNGEKVDAAKAYRMFKTKSVKRMAELRPRWRVVIGEPKLLYCYPLRLSVPKVLELIGGDGARYNEVRASPQPWD
jgi:hypothetical protein